jgi:hypothetical protein
MINRSIIPHVGDAYDWGIGKTIESVALFYKDSISTDESGTPTPDRLFPIFDVSDVIESPAIPKPLWPYFREESGFIAGNTMPSIDGHDLVNMPVNLGPSGDTDRIISFAQQSQLVAVAFIIRLTTTVRTYEDDGSGGVTSSDDTTTTDHTITLTTSTGGSFTIAATEPAAHDPPEAGDTETGRSAQIVSIIIPLLA